MLTPKGWFAVAGVTALVALGAWGAATVLRPKLAEAEGRVEVATDTAVSGQLTAEGAEQTAQAVEDYAARGGRIMENTYAARSDAYRAPDADDPLDAGRADRLGAHDRFLCEERPGLCAAPEGGAAEGGE